jgi:hypothetical protein
LRLTVNRVNNIHQFIRRTGPEPAIDGGRREANTATIQTKNLALADDVTAEADFRKKTAGPGETIINREDLLNDKEDNAEATDHSA